MLWRNDQAKANACQGPPVTHTGQDPVHRNLLGAAPLSTELVVTSGWHDPFRWSLHLDDTSRIFIVEQRSGSTGRIKIFNLDTGTLNSTPFLSLTVSTSSEQGLLGLAFHPNYSQNGYFYVNYTASGDTVHQAIHSFVKSRYCKLW